jgi:hypothetical protein
VTAHFEGERILLDEPLELEPNAKLIVTVLPDQDLDRDVWQSLAKRSLPMPMQMTKRTIHQAI